MSYWHELVGDQLVNGTRICILTIVDTFAREGLAANAGCSTRIEKVVDLVSE